MLTPRCAGHCFVFGGIWFLLAWTSAAAGAPASHELFRQYCVKCHGMDGTGSPARSPLPEIPDFTNASWQAPRNEEQLEVSILDGKGKDMPAFRGKLNKEQARELAAHVQSFVQTTNKRGGGKPKPPTSSSSLAEEFRRLEKEMDELRRQFRELSDPSKPPASAPAREPTAGEVFKQYCVKCHRSDGTGSEARRRQSEIPDFTNPAWQARRSDAQLLASIRDGKGKGMPSFRDKIGNNQARSLVAYIRAFTPTTDSPEKEAQEQPIPVEPADVAQPGPSIGKGFGGDLRFPGASSVMIRIPLRLFLSKECLP
jgi:mono/diheme cytochrome c family protein